MAAPTKNFTDPSGTPFRLLDGGVVSSAWSAVSGAINEAGRMGFVLLPPSAPDFRMTNAAMLAADRRVEVNNGVKSKVPPPPMGRQILLTFPPIYKERDANSSRILAGQTWPRYAKSGG